MVPRVASIGGIFITDIRTPLNNPTRTDTPRAAIIDINAGQVDCSFVRVPYDIDKAAEGIINSELPDIFADKLRTAS